MLKQHAILEIEINGRTYQLHLPNECPLGEVHDVLFKMRSYIIDRINDAAKQDAPKIEELPKQEAGNG